MKNGRPRLVAVGGGTGLSVALTGLKGWFEPGGDGLTAIVNVADDGGSSGRLRRSFSVPPPGDVRKCLLALADGDPTLAALFRFRFGGLHDVGGHSLGNLLMAALAEIGGGDFRSAVACAAQLLRVRGRVLPATVDGVEIVAEFTDGTWAAGESQIPKMGRRIRRVHLQPDTCRALPEACAAVAEADLIVLGPGSLYTSLIPVLLLPDLAAAFACSAAPVVLVANLMTEPGETDGYDVCDLVQAIEAHAPAVAIHYVLLNRRPISREVVALYGATGARPMRADRRTLQQLGCAVVEGDFIGDGALARHDSTKLAQAIIDLLPSPMRRPDIAPVRPLMPEADVREVK